MDLIHTNSKGEDVGVLKDYTFDLAFGSDENDFELTLDVNNHCCEADSFIYIEGTEYGGIVDKVNVVTKDDKLSYKGRTWHGILDSKIIEPMSVSGEANNVLANLLVKVGLTDLFITPSVDSGITIPKYSFDEYTKAYSGITKMLASVSAKLHFVFMDGQVVISVLPIVDYSKDEQFDSDQVEMDIEQTFNSVNHLICVGKKDSEEELPILHLYKGADGKFKEADVPTFTGIHEITDTYEYSKQEDLDELRTDLENGKMDKLQDYLSVDKVQMDFASEEAVYDVGDIVGAKEITTGASATERITKKIVTISQGVVNINYKVGD